MFAIGTAMSEGSHSSGKSSSKFDAADFAVASVCSLVAFPLCDAGWHAIVVEHDAMTRGAIGLAVGLPVGLLGLSFHWWKNFVPSVRDWVLPEAKRWWPAAIALCVVYVAGPEIYRRAAAPSPAVTAPAHEPKAETDSPPVNKQPASEGIITGLQAANELRELRSQVDELRRQRDAALADAKRKSTPTVQSHVVSGPVEWLLDGQLIVASFDGKSYGVNGLIFQGTSKTAFHFKEAYLVSGLTGHRVELQANVHKVGAYYPVTAVDIPMGAPVQIDYMFKPPLSIRDFVDQWGKFRFMVVYEDGSTFEHDYSEDEVRKQAQRQLPDAFGPQVTPKEQR